MAQNNWQWIEAVNPPSIYAGFKPKLYGRFKNRRLGSFWDCIDARAYKPAYNAKGELINHIAGKGKTVRGSERTVVPHTQAVKTLVWSERQGQMIVVQTG